MAAVVALLVLVMPDAVRADVTAAQPFVGVTHFHDVRTGPAPLSIHVVRVDLDAPGISLLVTEPNGAAPGETTLETTTGFVDRVGAQIGINANFFELPFPGQPYADAVGLAASGGEIYSNFLPWTASVAFGAGNSASFLDAMPADPTGIIHAVSGFQRLIRAGVITGEGDDVALQPRSALVLTAANELLLVTVDGRNPLHSVGLSTIQLAQVLLEYGAVEAINLDGGASTTLAMADLPGQPTRLVNIPSGSLSQGIPPGVQRPVGVNLAIFATPVPEPGGLGLTLLGAAGLLAGRLARRRAA